jgi:hypothetical protein
MTEVTYYVALPFVAADDGIAAGEPTECFNPVAVVMRAEALARKEGHIGRRSRLRSLVCPVHFAGAEVVLSGDSVMVHFASTICKVL